MTTPKKPGQVNNPFPFPLNVNGGGNQSQQSATPQTFWDNLNNMLTARASVGLVNQLEHPDAARPAKSPVEDMAALANAFGFNLPAMQQRYDASLMELNKAQTEAQRAKAEADLQSIRNELQQFKDALQQEPPQDPLREALLKKALEEDPLTKAAREQFMARMMAPAQPPPSLMQQFLEFKKLENEMRGVFAPAPAAHAGMTADQLFSIELKKLELQERLDLKRVEKEYETATNQAAAWKEIINTVANVGGQIGEFIVNRMMPGNEVALPALTPARVAQGDKPAATLTCPDCGQESVSISQDVMAALTETHEPQSVTCSNCGVEHELTPPGSGPASQQSQSAVANGEADVEPEPPAEPAALPPPTARRNVKAPARPGFSRLAGVLPEYDAIRKG